MDLYATAIVLFEMLSSKKPFDAPEVSEVFMRQIGMPPPPIRTVAPDAGFSGDLEAFLLRAMAKVPANRFPSAATMMAALDELPEAAAHAAPPVTGARRNSDKTIFDPLPAGLTAGDTTVRAPLPSKAQLRTGERRRGGDRRGACLVGRALGSGKSPAFGGGSGFRCRGDCGHGHRASPAATPQLSKTGISDRPRPQRARPQKPSPLESRLRLAPRHNPRHRPAWTDPSSIACWPSGVQSLATRSTLWLWHFSTSSNAGGPPA